MVQENLDRDKALAEIQKNKRKENELSAQKPPKVRVVHSLVL